MSSSRSNVVVGGLILLALGANPARADKCSGAKLNAIGKKESGLLVCQAKVAKAGGSSGLAACEAKVVSKFNTAFTELVGCAGDGPRCEAIADGCESSVAVAFSGTLPSVCEAAKRRAAAKLARSELACYAKAAQEMTPVDMVACLPKATSKFSAAISKAGTCPDGGFPQMLVESKCVYAVVTTDNGGMVTGECPTPTTTTTLPPCTTSSCGDPCTSSCGAGTCFPPAESGPCASDADCAANTFCSQGTCIPCAGIHNHEGSGAICLPQSTSCSAGCGSDADCGPGMACVVLPTGPFFDFGTFCCTVCP
jgi:hypothetical protein